MDPAEPRTYLAEFPLKAERLDLHLCGAESAAECYEAIVEDRDHLARWMRWDPMVATLDSTRSFQEDARDRTERGAALELILRRRPDGRFLGQIGVAEFRHVGEEAVVGYWIRGSEGGKGYAPEALSELVRFLFQKLRIRRIVALVLPGNDRSVRVLEKLGFRREGNEMIRGMGQCSGKEAMVFVITPP